MSWFPRYTSDGTHLLSGAGLLYDHDSPLIEHGEHLVGWNPVPINNRHVLYNGGPGGTRLYDLWTRQSVQMYAGELIELAGGGNKWAGRDASRNVLVLWDGREIPNAGQPAISDDGQLIYRTGDDMIEPSICRTATCWGDGHGRLRGFFHDAAGIEDFTVGPAEYRPVLIDTPEGPWVLCMTPTSLHLRPLFSAEGFKPPADLVGDNRNLHAHAVCVGTTMLCVWNDAQGNQIHWRKDLSEPRITLNAVPTIPNPVPSPSPDPEPIRMHLPNDVKATITALWPKVMLLHQGDDEQRRKGTRIIAEQVRFSHGDAWGTKSADHGRPPSKDALAFQKDGRLYGKDLINGSSRELVLDGEMEDITGQTFIPVMPLNHLGDVTQPPVPIPDPPPVVCMDCAELRLIVKQLNTDLAMLRGVLEGIAGDLEDTEHSLVRRIVALENRPTFDVTKYKTKSNGGWLGHSHDLEPK